MNYDAALFDLDGTLLNTIPDLADATNAMRVQMNMAPLSVDLIATYVGKGTENLVARALAPDLGASATDEQIRTGLDIFYRCYHLINGDKTAVYAGVVEGLSELREMRVKMAVVTNKPTEFTLPLLQRSGLAHYFDAVVCGDTCARKKPDPLPYLHGCELLDVQPARAFVVGDSMNDAQAARAAGITVLAVPYGYNEGHSVHNLPVDGIVPSIADAVQWAKAH